jgi:hypothetical protein
MWWKSDDAQTKQHRIGDLLVEFGVSREAVDRALAIQKRKTPLGEILIAMGAATPEQIQAARLEQKVRRGTANHRERSSYRRRLAADLGKLAKSSRETTLRP